MPTIDLLSIMHVVLYFPPEVCRVIPLHTQCNKPVKALLMLVGIHGVCSVCNSLTAVSALWEMLHMGTVERPI